MTHSFFLSYQRGKRERPFLLYLITKVTYILLSLLYYTYSNQCLCLLLLPTLPYQSAERASSRQRKVAQSPLLIWLRCFLWCTDFGV